MSGGRPILNVLRVARLPIFTQLNLEEALLRATADNWLIINDGAFTPAIVLGISGRPAELVRCPEALQSGIQVIRRFTGGGTVVVDHDTVFSTLIMQAEDVPHVQPYPQPIMAWTEQLYRPAFTMTKCPDFSVRENDYVIGGTHKVGGNAQAITGKRWLHHTSFLWDYDQEAMALLRPPPRAPRYREGREHGEFVTRLCDVLAPEGSDNDGAGPAATRRHLVSAIVQAASALGFTLQERTLAEAAPALQRKPHLGTRLVDLREFLSDQELATLGALQQQGSQPGP
ncbi:hypothetical protein HYH03_005374 [Edaphochlamys debaryana]|uniref:BPL/LPL catalytic domain-containing protein n=1 Tax=Edaphochlamys debaryana TaxID=47281 RepID=A0A835Y986_9CHLO|nr:hypothetical protein HYH03_005374 [Edaphochlamys debaryana]|eukprot:KAG2496551.1 hypothetical protein HYH03_005374 [Edaphochlamys debaryana]